MLSTVRAIVLKTFRYGDRSLVLKAYTGHAGLRTYIVRPGKGGSAMLQALNRIELVVDENQQRDIHHAREFRVHAPYGRIGVEPMRSIVALFVQEVLYRVLREEAADPALFGFLEDALERLDSAGGVRYFPAIFLVRLSEHLGFLPVAPEEGEDRFDLREGHFVRGAAQHGSTMAPLPSAALAALLPLQLGGSPDPEVPAAVRRELLDHLLLYYRIHLEGVGELRSPAVLHQVLG